MSSSDDPFEVLYRAAMGARDAADFRTAERYAKELVALSESRGDRHWLAMAYVILAPALGQRNDSRGAGEAARKARDLFRELHDEVGEARALMALGAIALDINLDSSTARNYYDECVPMIRRAKDRRLLAVALGNLSEIARLEGDYRIALKHSTESLEIFRALGDHARSGWQLVNTAHYHALSRDYDTAVERLREAFDELTLERNPRWLAWYFDVWIIIAASSQRWETVARLRGFTDRYRDEHNVHRLQAMLPWLSMPFEQVWKNLPQERVDELLIEGESLTVEQAHAIAVDGTS